MADEELKDLTHFSFNPPKGKNEVENRDFPKIGTAEKWFRIIFAIIMFGGVITYLVLGWIFKKPTTAWDTSSQTPEMIVVTAFALIYSIYLYISTRYETSWANGKDAKALKRRKIFSAIANYALLAGSYTVYACTVMSYPVLHRFYEGYNYNPVATVFFYIVLALVYILCVVGVILNGSEKHKTAARVFNVTVLATVSWLIICFMAVLTKSYSFARARIDGNGGIAMIIFAAVCEDFAAIFLALSKKYPFMRTLYHFFISGAVTLFGIAILYFGLVA